MKQVREVCSLTALVHLASRICLLFATTSEYHHIAPKITALSRLKKSFSGINNIIQARCLFVGSKTNEKQEDGWLGEGGEGGEEGEGGNQPVASRDIMEIFPDGTSEGAVSAAMILIGQDAKTFRQQTSFVAIGAWRGPNWPGGR